MEFAQTVWETTEEDNPTLKKINGNVHNKEKTKYFRARQPRLNIDKLNLILHLYLHWPFSTSRLINKTQSTLRVHILQAVELPGQPSPDANLQCSYAQFIHQIYPIPSLPQRQVLRPQRL